MERGGIVRVKKMTVVVVRMLIGMAALLSGAAAWAADLQISRYDAAPDPVGNGGGVIFTVRAANNSATAAPPSVARAAICAVSNSSNAQASRR